MNMAKDLKGNFRKKFEEGEELRATESLWEQPPDK
jgi:hypothetical protein